MIRTALIQQRIEQFQKAAAQARQEARSESLSGSMFRDGQADAFDTSAKLLQAILDRHEPDQERVARWVRETMDEATLKNVRERCLRFIEEALELVQALDMSREDVLMMVEYVYARKAGAPNQELGGVMVTALALAAAAQLDAYDELHRELDRIFAAQDRVREKHRQKIEQGVAE